MIGDSSQQECKMCGFRDVRRGQPEGRELVEACEDRNLDSILQDCVVDALMGALQDYSIDSRSEGNMILAICNFGPLLRLLTYISTTYVPVHLA